MRTIFIVILSFLTASIIGQIPTNGLIGAWTFNGNANDASISANHGTVVGATLVPDRCGVPNSAYSFNGSSNYIHMLSAGPTGSVSRSVSFWAKTTATNLMTTFAYGNSSGGLAYAIQHNYNCSGVGVDVNNQALTRGSNCLINNGWHHIVAILNSTVGIQLSNVIFYVDGVQLPLISCVISGSTQAINTGSIFPISIGRIHDGPSRFFNGILDDFYLYDRAISSSEVMQLFNSSPCPQPVIGNTLVCPGSTNIYSVSPILNATYSWTLPGGWTGTSSTNTIVAIAGTGSGTISAIATSTCGVQANYALVVSTLTSPILNVSSTHSPLCIGSTATLTASGANTYTWQPGGSFNNTISITPATNSSYSLSGSGLNGCSTTTVFTQLVANSATIISFASPMLCSGSAVTLNAIGGTSYTWQPGNLTGSLVTVSPTINTTYTVTGFSSGNCSGSSIVMVPVPPPLTLNISASSPTACLGNAIIFTANTSGGSAGYNYSWVGGPSTATNSVNPSIAGTYIYTVTSTDSNTCSITQTTSVSFIQLLNLNSSSVAICPSTITTLTVSGAATYTWYPGGAIGNSHAVSPTSASVYTVIGTSITGCTASATKTVLIKSSPTLSFVTATITCGSLGSATVNASGTPGPFNFSWTPTSQTGSVATGLYPGSYTITVFDVGTGCVYTPTTSFTPLIPLTGTVSATASLACRSVNVGTAGIALAGGSGTQTYLWTDANGSQTNSVASGLAAGVNTVTVIDALTFCNVTHTFLITEPSAFTLNIASSSPSVCMGGSISYTASNSGGTPGYTYSWINGPSGNLNLVNETISGLYIYSVTSVDANSCTVTNTIAANFVPNPTISVSNTSICPLSVGSLTATGASSYSWSNGSTANPLFVSPSGTQQYTVVGTAAACTAIAIGDVFLKPIPVVNFTTNAPLCQGSTLILSSTSSHSIYHWSGPQNFTASTGTTIIFSIAATMSGNYTLKVTAANSCTASATASVTVYPTPALTASSNTVCQGQALNLFSSYVPGGSYLWLGPSYSSTLQNNVLQNSNPTMSGNYTVKVTSVSGCTNVATVHASVIASPIPVIITSGNFCVGEPVILNGFGGNIYSWSGPNGFHSSAQTPTINNIGLSATGTYSLYVYTAGCYAITTKYITVHALPVFTLSSNSPVCENASISLTTNASVASYIWAGPNGFTSSSQSPLFTANSMSYAGTYSLHATDANGCVASNFVNVSMLPAPLVTVNSVTVCLGGAVTLSASSNGISYSWSGPQNFTGSVSTVYIPVVNSNNTGLYSVTVAGSNSCTTTSTLNVNGFSFELPTPVISGSDKVCMNSTFTLQASGGNTYEWTGPKNFLATKKDIQVFVDGFNVAGIYTLTAKNESNCVSSTTIDVTVYQSPKGNLLSSQNNLCEPYCTELRFDELKNVAPVTKTEFFMDTKVLKDSLKSFCFTKSGYYQAKVNYVDSNNCVSTSTLLMVVNPKPKADFEFTPLSPVAAIDKVQFYNSSSGEGLGTWQWFLMRNDSVKSRENSPQFLYEASGKYPVVLIAENKWGCTDTAIKILFIDDEFNLFVPNAFTPNGDGLNDIFKPKGQGISNYTLEIFDRWGEQIFKTNDFYTGWDGTFKGKNCKTDIYVWKITATSSQRERKTITGQLTLLRGEIVAEY